MNEKWDYLIILDACRYDYFHRYYKKYFKNGELKKTISPSTWTLEWAEKNFQNYYDDLIYISSVPFINSLKEVSWHGSKFNAKKHFFKVINAWDIGWNDEVSAIPPKNMTKIALEQIKKNPTKRIIIHYCQPHFPYLNYPDLNKIKRKEKKKIRFRRDTIKEKIKLAMASLLVKLGGTIIIWKINKRLNIFQIRYMEFIWRKLGSNGIIDGYKFNINRIINAILCY